MTINIRFKLENEKTFYCQEKRWWGWKTLYTKSHGYILHSEDKQDLLKKVIDEYYETTKKHLEIHEYPMIKRYTKGYKF
jgi:hypothetical protein